MSVPGSSKKPKILFVRKDVKWAVAFNLVTKFLQDSRPEIAKDDVSKNVTRARPNGRPADVSLISNVPMCIKM